MTKLQTYSILALLSAKDRDLSSVEIHKLLFLHSQVEYSTLYDFIPYQKGCYSLTLAHDLQVMRKKGLIDFFVDVNEERKWCLTLSGEALLFNQQQLLHTFRVFLKKFPFGEKELMRYTYLNYPYWASRSKVIDEIFSDNSSLICAIQSAWPKKRNVRLASIGYEGRTIESYLNALVSEGIDVLVDVRCNPLSRKFGFSKKVLKSACDLVGIEYYHIKQLGIPSDRRQILKTQQDYDLLFSWYEENVLTTAQSSLDSICSIMSLGKNVALTCYEANPRQCHRSRILSVIEQRMNVRSVLI